MSNTIYIKSHNASSIKIDAEMHVYNGLYDHFAYRPAGYKFMPSFKNKQWDGFFRLFNARARSLPLGLIPRLEKYAEQIGEEVDFSQYKNMSGDPDITIEEVEEFAEYLNIHSQGTKITPHDYQIDAVYESIKNGRLVALAPTSAGKSLILYIFLQWHMAHTKNAKMLLVVPSVSLVHQMFGDFKDYASNFDTQPEEYSHLIMSGKEKHTNMPLTISTWQSLQNMAKGKTAGGDEYFSAFNVVACDEVHGAKGKQLTSIMDKCINAYIRLGVTGTLDGTDLMQIHLEGVFGPVYQVTTTKELMDRGAVSQMDIKFLMLDYPDEIKKVCQKLTYQQEIDFLTTHETRLKFIANLSLSLKGNTLILVNLVEKHGKPLYEYIKSKAGENRKVFFIHGKVDGEVRNAMRAIMEQEDDAIIVASFGTMSTGTNIRRLHNVIFGSPSKSQIRVLQSLGRGLRLGNGKTHFTLYDIGDDLHWKSHKNHTLLHAIERIKMYTQQQFAYKLIKVPIK